MKRVNIFPMRIDKGRIEEIHLDGCARIHCAPDLIPAPGQYLIAHADGSNAPLPVALFSSLSLSRNGFRAAPPVPSFWKPGDSLTLRGPIGRGFSMPSSVRKIVLLAFDGAPIRLLGLVAPALKQGGEVVVVCDAKTEDLPEAVEVQPLRAMSDAFAWADYAALDVDRENLNQLKKRLATLEPLAARIEAQVLIRAPMPCGALADCGVCALSLHHEWKMICKDGPVFELGELP